MEKLYHPDNICRFTDSLIRAVENNDEPNTENLLLVLKMLVNGPPGERCQNFYNRTLPPDRCIAAVLKTKRTQDALRDDQEKCEKLINMLLGLPYLTNQLCRALSILITCLDPSSFLKMNIATRILSHEDLYKFDLRTVQRCLEQNTFELEMTAIKLCTQPPSEEDFFRNFDHWVRWCSQSSDVFQVVSGIFNELLSRLKCKKRVLSVVNMFIKELRTTCDVNGIDLVSLKKKNINLIVPKTFIYLNEIRHNQKDDSAAKNKNEILTNENN
ncbi:hypothetical protein GE061_005143 [Apolygus lucorum]|uniref:Uncharacterized protein n=1 Tax=Apolygus lucorum TaxID=248454 RepID=A0A8S9WWV9_APOLU|nr:hypothetical protein GE061_005143 [Apolygus lucorum]